MLVVLVCIRLADLGFSHLFTGEPMFFGRVPVRFFFDAGEAGVMLVFVVASIIEAARIMML